MGESAPRVLAGNEHSSNKKKWAEVTNDRRDVQILGAGKCGRRRLSEEGLFLFKGKSSLIS